MTNRRDFLKVAAGVGLASAIPAVAGVPIATPAQGGAAAEVNDRRYWVSVMERIARPLLESLAAEQLRKNMPVESSGTDRALYTHLEGFGRLLYGLAPWLVAAPADDAEKQVQQRLLKLTQTCLDVSTNPQSPDFLNFSRGGQALVDTAFFAQGILRGKAALWDALEPRVKQQIVAALKTSRTANTPTNNNWVMFAATVEAALLDFGEEVRHDRLEADVRRMVAWYKGDGVYGDGDFFHFDYYNAFVIHPMLLDCLAVLNAHDPRFADAYRIVLQRAVRYAQIQERLIAPDGTFPSIGRSTAYRFGAFQVLAQIALLGKLPAVVKPAQVRCALTAVIRRMIEAPGTFDDKGWLRIGFCGHQPALGETYISTGSLYLCMAGMLPLGLAGSDAFWKDPAVRWTQQALWSGENLAADHALNGDVANVVIPDPQ